MFPTDPMHREQRKAVVLEYFRRLDAGGDLLALFAEDATARFPKWGIARGRAAIGQMFRDVGGLISEIHHHHEQFNVVLEQDMVVVEGTSHGVTADGTPWRAGDTHAGRWCDVFEVRDFAIQRCFVYLDPDYGDADTDRYPWIGNGPLDA